MSEISFTNETLDDTYTTFIASAVRSWKQGGAIVELFFDHSKLQFRVKYTEITLDRGLISTIIPPLCTKAWIGTFVRDQEYLQEDSYYVLGAVPEFWRPLLLNLWEGDKNR